MPTPDAAAQQAEALRLRRRFGRQIGFAFVLALGLCLVMLARTS
jgi:tetrahydromethanopterin S-methyltransferase subunit G